jgi:hypothetical protein
LDGAQRRRPHGDEGDKRAPQDGMTSWRTSHEDRYPR